MGGSSGPVGDKRLGIRNEGPGFSRSSMGRDQRILSNGDSARSAATPPPAGQRAQLQRGWFRVGV